MKTYGLIGHPLGHSFSRSYFTEKFAKEGIDAHYVNYDIPSVDCVNDILDNTPGLCGFNVTIPYKQLIMPMLSSIVPMAAEIGAVNVVKVEKDGKLTGHNTDIIGFRDSLSPHLKPIHKYALILGTGGASLAVAAALRQLGIEYMFVSRTPRSSMLSYRELTTEVMDKYKVIINATPLGTYPDADSCPPIPYDLLDKRSLCYDLVYNPAVTKFLRQAAEHGADTENGRRMLIIQAEESWKIWNSK